MIISFDCPSLINRMYEYLKAKSSKIPKISGLTEQAKFCKTLGDINTKNKHKMRNGKANFALSKLFKIKQANINISVNEQA
jgi:hypothetical protein